MPASRTVPTPRGALIAAPSSGAGKTTTTLALLRSLKNSGRSVVSAKSGPDYIDPKFHEAATGRPCLNLDAWAMDRATLHTLAARHSSAHDVFLVEGAMGLFDGAANGRGTAADLSAELGLPVILVVDCAKQAQSVGALVHGFQTFRPDVTIAGIILNRVGSARHETMLKRALEPLRIKVLGVLPRLEALILPERHLGLVQAGEHEDLDEFLEQASAICTDHVDLDALEEIGTAVPSDAEANPDLPVPLGQKTAVARDVAFAFSYPHLLDFWQSRGAELCFFSPLADETPSPDADAIFLPGGYPELHAGKLASAQRFKAGLQQAAQTGKLIYGECGGYMTLGTGLIDASGMRHEMLGLLPVETSFETRKRHLGYRRLQPLGSLPWTREIAAHEFHYASIVTEGEGPRLFKAQDAEGSALAEMGLRQGTVMGSFAHVISCAANPGS